MHICIFIYLIIFGVCLRVYFYVLFHSFTEKYERMVYHRRGISSVHGTSTNIFVLMNSLLFFILILRVWWPFFFFFFFFALQFRFIVYGAVTLQIKLKSLVVKRWLMCWVYDSLLTDLFTYSNVKVKSKVFLTASKTVFGADAVVQQNYCLLTSSNIWRVRILVFPPR